MTKKHYDAIAAILLETVNHDSNYTDQTKKAIRITAQQLAHYFAADNPKFQRDKFLAACGIKTK